MLESRYTGEDTLDIIGLRRGCGLVDLGNAYV